MAATQTIPMDELLKSSPQMIIPNPGELLEGSVISVSKHRILVDIGGVNTGIISGRETKDSLNTIKELAPGDAVFSCVLESENEDGFVLLSLRKASQERAWKRFEGAHNDDEVVDVKPTEANKGGLLLEVDGIKGFIPVS